MVDGERTLRLTVGPQAVAVVIAAIAVAIALFAVVAAASRPLGWALACAVVAALIEPLVARLDQRVPRPLAIVVVLFGVAVVGAGVAGGIITDLDNQYDRLQEAAPRAAARLERSERFGELARDFRLQDRAEEVLDRLANPTDQVPVSAATTTSTYVVCGILTAFFLSWGPKLGRAGAEQITDSRTRVQVRYVGRLAFRRGRRYLLIAVLEATVAGLAAFAVCWWADLPAPIVLSVFVAGCSVVPGFGVVIGCLPALLLSAGLEPASTTVALAIAFAALQVAHHVALRRLVHAQSLAVGPAAIVIAMIVGFEIYGIGGAFYAAAVAVFAMAVLDAAGHRSEAAA